ncbi:MAG TPA: glycosyltransferase family 39 protein [Polyangiaceae bacterium]|nr:glycosyltransferase family 39 protein [Polyangiaceae bacterium]
MALGIAWTTVALGVWLRSRAVTTAPLWLDEASWAMRLMDEPLSELVIRPPGFMFIERALARAFSPSEGVLRFIPWLAGVGCVLLSVPLGRRLFRSEAARLLFVGLIALDPMAIELSKEFKPYSVSLTLHASLMFLSLKYAASGRTRELVGLLVLSVLAVLFAQDVLFAYPGIFILLAIDTFRARRLRHLAATVVACALTLTVVGGLYHYVWSQLNQPKVERRWGKKYDVFYVSGGSQTDWVLERYTGLVETPTLRRLTWRPSKRISKKAVTELASSYAAVFLVLNIAGALSLVRRKQWRECVLLMLPLVVMLGFNLYGFWPFGAFRTNLFTVVYVAALASAAVERAPLRTRALDFAPVALLVFWPLFAFEKKWHATKKAASLFPDAMRELVRLHGPPVPGHKDVLVGDGTYTCPMYKYYTMYHPVYSKTIGPQLLKTFNLNCRSDRIPAMINTARSSLRGPGDHVWMLFSRAAYFPQIPKPIEGDLHQFVWSMVGDMHIIVGLERAHAAEPMTTPEAPAGPDEPAPVDEPEGSGMQ